MRKPDLIIGPSSNPYLYRWHILRVFGYQLALHKMMRDDDDRALHDHRSWNVSLILRGGYHEITFGDYPGGPARPFAWLVRRWRRPGSIIFRDATTPHRLTVGPRGPSWSLWLRGPPLREWGFHCPKDWRHWREFCGEDYTDGGVSTVGKGCD